MGVKGGGRGGGGKGSLRGPIQPFRFRISKRQLYQRLL